MQITQRGTARFLIAVACGTAFGVGLSTLVSFLNLWLSGAQYPPGYLRIFFFQTLIFGLPMFGLMSVVAITIYILVLRPEHDHECRCRRCGYILKSLTRLECPECGEVI